MFRDYKTIFGKEIDMYKNLIKEQEAEITKREIIIDSLKESMVREIQGIVIPYSGKMLDEAWSQQHKPTKAERKMFEFVKGDLLERLFKKEELKEVKFKNITPLLSDGNHCVYHFQFEYKGITFEVSIPNVKVASTENIDHMRYGMYMLMYEEESSIWDFIAESYDLDDIAKAIHEFVEKGK